MTSGVHGDLERPTDGESAALASVSSPAVGAASAIVEPIDDPAFGAGTGSAPTGATEQRSFLRRHRLPLALGAIAICLYAGSIVYILFGRGQLA